MTGPKISVIGAGSYFFGNPLIHKMATSKVFEKSTLALVDTKKEKLETMIRLAKRIFRETRSNIKIVGSTNRKEILEGSDFVVLTFSRKNAYYRGIDTEVSAKHGIRMCSGDTIGPGGIFRALREVPKALEIAQDTLELAPSAWVINFVNPTAVLGVALRKYAPKLKSFALCDAHHEPYCTLRWCKKADIVSPETTSLPEQVNRNLDLSIAGVNHCTWIIRFNYKGKSVIPILVNKLRNEAKKEKINPGKHSKARYNASYALRLYQIYGTISTSIGHTKEYVPFFQGYGCNSIEPEPIALFDSDSRTKDMEDAWRKTQRYADGKISAKCFLNSTADDHASDIMESMWGNLGKQFYINTTNQCAVTNLPPDAFLELKCDLDMKGPRPQPVGEIPRGILSLEHQVLDTHELTAEAAVTGDKSVLLRAFMTDPICNNISDAESCMEELLDLERESLPAYWYR